MSASSSPTFGQFSLRTLLILVTLAALVTLPIYHFTRSRWRFRQYTQPDVVRERSLDWMRKNAPADRSTATMQSQESDLPSP